MNADDWREELGRSYRTAEDLAREGFIREDERASYEPLLARYKFLLPRHYAALIDHNDAHCPIRRQAIPSPRELEKRRELKADPLNDLEHRPTPRLTHRYRNRALLHLTQNCSMYCRYCFRKTLLNELSDDFFRGALDDALAYLTRTPEIEEVILSGGDPLLVSDANLGAALSRLAAISHIKRLRVHTRVPVTFPIRVTEALASVLSGTRLPVVVVTHFNHPRELTAQSATAAVTLRARGIHLLNQSVLLEGVNDNVETLSQLSEGLFTLGILPYYLHHPDRAEGTHHFDLSMERGSAIYEALRARLPGYLVPKYVVDIVGVPYKLNVFETMAEGTALGRA